MTELALDVVCQDMSVAFSGPGASNRLVLNNLSLAVEAGEVIVLLGQSGCGKSTLLRSIAGLQAIQSGTISIGQRPIEAMRSQLAFVFQEPALLPWRTAVENVCLPFEMRAGDGVALASSKQYRIASRMLLNLGFAQSDENKFPSQLSGGMKMRVSLARALVGQPKLLLLDEPFAALDDMLRWRLNEMLLQQAANQSRTMIFVTHNMAEAVFLSDRIAIMHQGTIAEWIENNLPKERTSELRATAEFARLYGQVASRLREVTEST
jgi:NitT/TauT family transport system ATP-binding protein